MDAFPSEVRSIAERPSALDHFPTKAGLVLPTNWTATGVRGGSSTSLTSALQPMKETQAVNTTACVRGANPQRVISLEPFSWHRRRRSSENQRLRPLFDTRSSAEHLPHSSAYRLGSVP